MDHKPIKQAHSYIPIIYNNKIKYMIVIIQGNNRNWTETKTKSKRKRKRSQNENESPKKNIDQIFFWFRSRQIFLDTKVFIYWFGDNQYVRIVLDYLDRWRFEWFVVLHIIIYVVDDLAHYHMSFSYLFEMNFIVHKHARIF